MMPRSGGVAVVTRGRADDGAGQQFADQRQTGALVLAERQHHAARLGVHHRRVGRGFAGMVEQRAVEHLLAGIVRHADLAHRDAAGGEIEQDRLVAGGAGDGDADRIGQEPALASAERRDRRRA